MIRPYRYLMWATAAACLFAGGCTGVYWLVAQFAPPQKVKPVYRPPRGKTYLVFVDDRNPVNYEPVKRELCERLSEQLEKHKIASGTIPYDKLLDLIAANPNFNAMHVPTVGAKCGADMVLYVQIEEFSLKDEQVSPLWRGRLEVVVKIVDCRKGRLWPADRPEGYPLPVVEIPETASSSPTYGEQLARSLADRAADRIAKLFYEHTVPAMDLGEAQ